MRVATCLFRRCPTPDGGAEQAGVPALGKRTFQRVAGSRVILGGKLPQPQWFIERRQARQLSLEAGFTGRVLHGIVVRLVEIQPPFAPGTNPRKTRPTECYRHARKFANGLRDLLPERAEI